MSIRRKTLKCCSVPFLVKTWFLPARGTACCFRPLCDMPSDLFCVHWSLGCTVWSTYGVPCFRWKQFYSTLLPQSRNPIVSVAPRSSQNFKFVSDSILIPGTREPDCWVKRRVWSYTGALLEGETLFHRATSSYSTRGILPHCAFPKYLLNSKPKNISVRNSFC